MRKVWVIARHDLRITLQSKRSWFLLLIVPALTIYLVGLGAQGLAHSFAPAIRIDVLDHDLSAASATFLDALAETNEMFVICPARDDAVNMCLLAEEPLSLELAEERLVNEVTSALIIIPEGFAAAFEKGGETNITFRSGVALTAPEIVFCAVQDVISRMSGPLVAARMSTQMAESQGVETGADFYAARLADAETSWGPPPPIQVIAEVSGPNEKLILGTRLLENGFRLSAPSITVMFVMVNILGLAQSLAEERMMGLLHRLGMMPVHKAHLLSGKMLATFLLGLFQFAVLIAFGELLGVDFGNAPLALMAVASAYVLAVTALALALSAMALAPNRASALATLAWVVLVPLGGGWWPLILVPAWLQTLGLLSPVAWCLDGLNALMFYQGTLADVLQPVGVLFLFAVVFFLIGIKKLNYQPTAGNDAILNMPYFGAHQDRAT